MLINNNIHISPSCGFGNRKCHPLTRPVQWGIKTQIDFVSFFSPFTVIEKQVWWSCMSVHRQVKMRTICMQKSLVMQY